MTKTTHTVYIGIMVTITIVVTIYLIYTGTDYYNTSLEERFYHPHHDWFKPSGSYGHGLGIIGTLMILFGVVIYIARKRYDFMVKYIRLKYLLEFHIFLCTLGPILILFHTAFKFGGIVSVAFWSMVAVVVSGVIGRFIYIQIPRTIEGRELSLNEVKNMKINLNTALNDHISADEKIMKVINDSMVDSTKENNLSYVAKYFADKKTVKSLKKALKTKQISSSERRYVLATVKNEISLSNKIARLNTMQNLFKYWHVAHLPFALIMLVIVVIHVIVTLAFGYKWIF